MFEVVAIPTVVIISQNNYYIFGKKAKLVKDFTDFLTGGFRDAQAIPLPERKSALGKLWFINRAAIEIGVSHLDTFGLEGLPHGAKVAIVLVITMAPFVGALIWACGPYTGQGITKERKEEIMAILREKARERKAGKGKGKGEDGLFDPEVECLKEDENDSGRKKNGKAS